MLVVTSFGIWKIYRQCSHFLCAPTLLPQVVILLFFVLLLHLCLDFLLQSPTVAAPCQCRDNMRWQPQPNTTPVYTGGTEGDSANQTHTSSVLPHHFQSISKQKTIEWQVPGVITFQHQLQISPPPSIQASPLWVSVAALHRLQHWAELSRKLQISAHCSLLSWALFLFIVLGYFCSLFCVGLRGNVRMKMVKRSKTSHGCATIFILKCLKTTNDCLYLHCPKCFQ